MKIEFHKGKETTLREVLDIVLKQKVQVAPTWIYDNEWGYLLLSMWKMDSVTGVSPITGAHWIVSYDRKINLVTHVVEGY